MTTQAARRLTSIEEEITGTRSHLAMIQERLATASAAVQESRLRMLIAETPIADRDVVVATREYRGVEREVARLQGALADLYAERDRLAAAVGGTP